MLADHHVVYIFVDAELILYCEDQDFGTDADAAGRRLKCLTDAGRHAWIEHFYGPVTNFGIGKLPYKRIDKPEEITR